MVQSVYEYYIISWNLDSDSIHRRLIIIEKKIMMMIIIIKLKMNRGE